jgi:hypothetical protein
VYVSPGFTDRGEGLLTEQGEIAVDSLVVEESVAGHVRVGGVLGLEGDGQRKAVGGDRLEGVTVFVYVRAVDGRDAFDVLVLPDGYRGTGFFGSIRHVLPPT